MRNNVLESIILKMKLSGKLSLQDFLSIAVQGEKIEIDDAVLRRVERSFEFLKSFSDDKVIYGVNTGFGPMAQYRIADSEKKELQYNLIRSHCGGIGNPLDESTAKAVMLARLNTLALGKSGVHPSVIFLLKELINREITPLIFEHGSVGASGDLVQLAHLALVLIGEGEVFYKGERKPTAEVFQNEGLTPIEIHIREGLGLMNGTSCMSGIGILNLHYSERIIEISLKLSCAILELVESYSDYFSEQLNNSKLHEGQRKIAEKMRSNLHDSKLVRRREDHLYTSGNSEEIFSQKVQEYYSLRCVPQILGPVLDTLHFSQEILENEINSANDNPIIIPDEDLVYHGGNFHGDYVALEMDKLKLAITRVSMLAERQLNYLMNSKINEIFPPFMNLGKLGFNFGMQGVQFTAVSTTAENQALSTSVYVHSIPNNNDNQDIVSMGTNAATMCAKVIDNTFEVLAIQAVTVAQAVDFLNAHGKISSATKNLYDEIRSIVPKFSDDPVLYPSIEKLKQHLKHNIKL